MSMDDMPDFRKEARDANRSYYEFMCKWLKGKGWIYFQALDVEPWNRIEGLDGLYAIATVQSQMYDGWHAVVVQFGDHLYPNAPKSYEKGGRTFEVVHDPNPKNDPYDLVDDDIIRWHFLFKVGE
jgi:hypothetical protein